MRGADSCGQQLWQQPGLHSEQHLRHACAAGVLPHVRGRPALHQRLPPTRCTASAATASMKVRTPARAWLQGALYMTPPQGRTTHTQAALQACPEPSAVLCNASCRLGCGSGSHKETRKMSHIRESRESHTPKGRLRTELVSCALRPGRGRHAGAHQPLLGRQGGRGR